MEIQHVNSALFKQNNEKTETPKEYVESIKQENTLNKEKEKGTDRDEVILFGFL
jgi:hypothetical protein